jgi:hypothetical protein
MGWTQVCSTAMAGAFCFFRFFSDFFYIRRYQMRAVFPLSRSHGLIVSEADIVY